MDKLPPEKITQETSVTGADYQRLNLGDRVAVRYMPNAPKEVILSGAVRDRTVPYFLTGGIAGVVASAVLILVGIAAWLR